MEFGPRALGHRSILAHPGEAATKTRLNALKQRADSVRWHPWHSPRKPTRGSSATATRS
ncbi:carbamoyltransferase C-terminal domain-containing protein [Streptomyces sp. NPDC056937]|uniref:carbamoyltransferase C-terminal domain-containing protein n=1 Tax=Streptomyces sp. NPDC056937 TaxID=3345969 RepID=UPI00363382F0